MSTELDIFPGRPELPWFEHVRALAEEQLHAWLRTIGVHARVELGTEIRAKSPDVVLVESARGPMSWDDDSYAWFTAADLEGGADAYYWPLDDVTTEYWNDDLLLRPAFARWREPMARAIEVGHCCHPLLDQRAGRGTAGDVRASAERGVARTNRAVGRGYADRFPPAAGLSTPIEIDSESSYALATCHQPRGTYSQSPGTSVEATVGVVSRS
jgi:hypothetical protein